MKLFASIALRIQIISFFILEIYFPNDITNHMKMKCFTSHDLKQENQVLCFVLPWAMTTIIHSIYCHVLFQNKIVQKSLTFGKCIIYFPLKCVCKNLSQNFHGYILPWLLTTYQMYPVWKIEDFHKCYFLNQMQHQRQWVHGKGTIACSNRLTNG